MFRPLVKRLGYEYPAGEHPSITKLRTEAITVAALRGDEECVVFLVHPLNISLTSLEGSSRNSSLALTTWSKLETIRGFLPTCRPSLTGSQSSMGAGNNGNSSRASTRPERLPLRASLQCEQVCSSWQFSITDPVFAPKVALWAKPRI